MGRPRIGVSRCPPARESLRGISAAGRSLGALRSMTGRKLSCWAARRAAQVCFSSKVEPTVWLRARRAIRGTRQSAHTVRFERTAVPFCVALGSTLVPSELRSKDRARNFLVAPTNSATIRLHTCYGF
jgi:hypothetical protein